MILTLLVPVFNHGWILTIPGTKPYPPSVLDVLIKEAKVVLMVPVES